MYMQKVKILVTSACNLKCLYCFNDTSVEYPQDINEDIYLFLDVLDSYHKIPVNFAFGEPLLAIEKIREVLKHINGNKYYAIFNTSAYGLNEEYVSVLNKLPINVSISCDGPKSLITRGFDPIKEYSALIAKLNSFSGFVSVITPYSYNPYVLKEYFSGYRFTLNRVKTRYKESIEISYDLVELQKIYKHIVSEVLAAKDPFKTSEFGWIREYIDNYLFYLGNPDYRKGQNLFLQSLTPVIDLAGELYYSTYYQNKLGNIYDSPDRIKSNFLEIASHYWEDCTKHCSAKEFCMGGVGGERKTYNMCSYINTICECLWPLVNSGLLEKYAVSNYIKEA